MLQVHAGRFPQQMKDPMPFPLVSWASDDKQVKSRNAPFSLVLSDDEQFFSMTFQDKDTCEWRTMGGACVYNPDTRVFRLDSLDSLDFWMEIKRIL